MVNANVGAGIAFAMPSESLGISVVIDSRLTARSLVDYDPNDRALIEGAGGAGIGACASEIRQ